MNKKVIFISLIIILIIALGVFIYRKNAGIIISSPEEAVEIIGNTTEEGTDFEQITLPPAENYESNDIEIYN